MSESELAGNPVIKQALAEMQAGAGLTRFYNRTDHIGERSYTRGLRARNDYYVLLYSNDPLSNPEALEDGRNRAMQSVTPGLLEFPDHRNRELPRIVAAAGRESLSLPRLTAYQVYAEVDRTTTESLRVLTPNSLPETVKLSAPSIERTRLVDLLRIVIFPDQNLADLLMNYRSMKDPHKKMPEDVRGAFGWLPGELTGVLYKAWRNGENLSERFLGQKVS